jgi:hypothetical protein
MMNDFEAFKSYTEDKIVDYSKKVENAEGELKEHLDKRLKDIEQKSTELNNKVKEY